MKSIIAINVGILKTVSYYLLFCVNFVNLESCKVLELQILTSIWYIKKTRLKSRNIKYVPTLSNLLIKVIDLKLKSDHPRSGIVRYQPEDKRCRSWAHSGPRRSGTDTSHTDRWSSRHVPVGNENGHELGEIRTSSRSASSACIGTYLLVKRNELFHSSSKERLKAKSIRKQLTSIYGFVQC